MPTPAEIRQTCEQRMRALLADMIPRQEVYRAMRGRYWQGARSHASTPTEGTATAPDPTRKVEDSESWQAFGVTLPGTVECAFEVHTYNSAQGDGWTLTALVAYGGDTYQRIANVGPESARSTAWEKLVQIP